MTVDWDFMEGGYLHEASSGEAVIRADLMTSHAQAFGELFASRDRRVQVSSSQLRAFFGDVKALEKKIPIGDQEAFERFYYQIMMLKSKASYVQGKKSGGRVSKAFRDYIHKCVDAIVTEQDFRAFLKFFESTVGFYYGAGGERIS